jgi:peptide-methionine (S)-S-oxide reductase
MRLSNNFLISVFTLIFLLFTNQTFAKNMTKNLPKFEKTILAGGCFWGMEELLRGLDGVVSTRVGYTGGNVPNATYNIVKTGLSGHAESVEVVYDPTKISFEKLLKFFFTIHDPTTPDRQGNDVGSQYRSEIFYFTDEQKKIAADVIRQADASKKFPAKIATKVEKAGEFYQAEDYHQDYLQKNPYGYTCHHPRKEWQF